MLKRCIKTPEEEAYAQVNVAIRKLLKDRNITQQRLAEIIGATPSRINQILNTDKNLTLKTLARIAAALHCKLVIELR